jgi:hypothetical protein
MKNLHTRVIVLNYFEDEVQLHTNDKEQQEWYAALGRMVAYGLYHDRNPAEELTTQYVDMGFRKDPVEIDAVYHEPVPQPRYEDGTPKFVGTADQDIKELRERLASSNCFIMGAVLRGDGKWGFHS